MVYHPEAARSDTGSGFQQMAGEPGQSAASAIALPKGGGAIRGIDEQFTVNPATGTASLTVPFRTSPSRSGFQPQFALSYDSGAGNGPFGLGWSLSVPAIRRRTDRGLPRYRDDEGSDTFVLSGAEDLVPALVQQGDTWQPHVLERDVDGETYRVQRYRPRVEGPFARIERWKHAGTGDVHWRSVTPDNVTSLYGQTPASRIADPQDGSRVFEWLLDETRDDRGNIIVYEYKAEDTAGVDRRLPHEANRLNGAAVFANRYLKRVRYGNRQPYQPGDWMFEVVFDYGEHEPADPTPDEVQARPWRARRDAFSTHRAGFEVRTYRLCRRVLMFHHFPELGDDPYLVRSTDFTYAENPVATYLTRIIHTGYTRAGDGYETAALPPIEFEYSRPQVDDTVRTLDAESLENLPVGLDNRLYRWIDLDGEGLSGLLTEQGGAWYYKPNLGEGRFGPVEQVSLVPGPGDLDDPRHQLLDLAGDGQKDLVLLGDGAPGFYERGRDADWQPFTPFESVPGVDWADPNLRWVDLTGDGRADLLITEDDLFVWYPSRGEEGFGLAEAVRRLGDEERGPALVFADPDQSIYLADMTGDGLVDIVRIRNSQVCYWPNQGYGRFGARVIMTNAPRFDQFDTADEFDQRRVHLADIDGSGTTDIIYLGKEGAGLWFNQAGNRWSDAHRLTAFPAVDNLAAVNVIDLLGNGAACLVWSSPLPADAHQPLRYIDLIGGTKPHLLTAMRNNMGLERTLTYAPSTRFYLADRAAGRPWITRLHFPVHVVERVEAYDAVAETRLVSRYRYHHGYFDGQEREFRGFGLVERWDAESFEAGDPAADATLRRPPVYTRSWFHTGAYTGRRRISRQYADEYYAGDPQAALLPDTRLPPGLTAEEERQACRTLKGRLLRQEVYAQDGTEHQDHPYTVTERTYRIRMVQPAAGQPHAVFHAFESEALIYHYERDPADPRISHQLTLAVDDFGNVTQAAAVAYPRRAPAEPEQGRLYITCTESDFVNRDDDPAFYRVGVPYETRSYELSGVAHAGPGPLSRQAVAEAVENAAEILFEADPAPNVLQKRLFGRTRTRYYRDDLAGPLPLGQVGSLGLVYEQYQQALTPGLVNGVFGNRVDANMLAEAGYLRQDGVWWAASGRQVFDPARFYLPVLYIDPFGAEYTARYDGHALLLEETRDPLGNTLVARNDYRTLQPALVTDANRNRAAAAFDPLGFVAATVVMGKEGENDPARRGDTLDDPTTRFEYHLRAWMDHRQPVHVRTFAREQHGAANPRWQETYTYFDGAGRIAMRKVQAEPGLAPARDDNGDLMRDAAGNLVWVDTAPDVRWVGTGRTVYDNKGDPVKQYEPYFSATSDYETERELVESGVTPILHYDPPGRLVRTDLPNGTFSRVDFDPWRQVAWDENDTVTDSDWYAQRQALPAGDPERRAAELAADHAGTPAVDHLDPLGRPFLTVADNGDAGQYRTRVALDIQGNQRSVTDALDRQVMVYDYDMLGNQVHLVSADAGERWLLPNVAGKLVRTWDSRGHAARNVYDALQRATHVYVSQGNQPEILAERTVYGEDHPDSVPPAPGAPAPCELNLRGQVYRQLDGAGVVTNEAFDFKGNLLRSTRRLARQYREQPDWSALEPLLDAAPPNALDLPVIDNALDQRLEADAFTTATTFDALNRPVTITTPDASVIRPGFNEANLLERVAVNLRGADAATYFVTDIDYNARGQRTRIQYASGVETSYIYDDATFRLTRLTTVRPNFPAGQRVAQDLRYTYDPVGNITELRDDAQQTIYFNNQVVPPQAEYVYDALYRLTGASGREHIGQQAAPQPVHNDRPRMHIPHPGDGQAMRNYSEAYEYDAVGNILRVVHAAANGNWTREYAYDEPNLAPTNNRLTSTSVGGVVARYTYDVHGNMTRMPHLPVMAWDFQDRLQRTQHQAVADAGDGETTYYIYDAAGQRVRKVTERQNGTRTDERIYIGEFELYRAYNGAGGNVTLERETLHVMDDTRRIALVETKTVDTQAPPFDPAPLIRYQFGNHLGSASLELDAAGNVIAYEEYYPYGSTAYQAGRDVAEVSRKRYRYAGKERDDETGLYYYGARYYAPWLGRWLSPDPLGIAGGINLYAFVNGNPISLNDLAGMQPTNEIDDLLIFLRSQAGFEAGAERPPVYDPNSPSQPFGSARRQASPFGTLAHKKATGVLEDMQRIWPESRRIVSEPVIVQGEVRSVGQGPAGAPKGSHVPDILVLQDEMDPVGRRVADVGEEIGDLKYGGGKAAAKYRQHGLPVKTINGKTTPSATTSLATTTDAAADVIQQASKVDVPSAGSGASILQKGKAALGTGGKVVGGALAVGGAALGGVKIGSGVNKIIEGKTAEGAIDIAEGGAELGLSIGVEAAIKSGSVAVGGSGAALALAGVAAGGSVALAAETARAAVRGEKTPLEIADEYYGTGFSDIYGWAQRSKYVPQPVKASQKAVMETLQDAYYNLFLK